ncbi:protein AGENET DOMAIN (AGD)-CONTAINING P1 isoform X1 [Juglans microcarpa x Juglans regia]|uniref:protein AGENET DOMAIN (AGD)-CONTAINING P1 isoform X1 n=1 Tax=Juglans microcarpa x Juglans regia TaxID=2249226 RepID=UPI001B7EF6C8|nr:protein AGENET DOMAIN (AGD)-CONTAINING P1 isoform X1 [Juglans microcarpa x Juglans regia]
MPPKLTTTTPSSFFPPGTPVEIGSHDAGFVGSWFAGTVLSSNRSKYSVQYETLVSDLDPSEPLCETLHVSQVRPVPPGETRGCFLVGDHVDAYWNDGWWEGEVTEDLGGGRYGVFFRVSEEQIEFGKEHLRLHRDWVSGKWVPPFEQQEVGKVSNAAGIVASGAKTTQEIFIKGTIVEVSSDEDGFRGAWFAASIVEAVEKDKFLVQYQNLRADDDSCFLREEIDTLHIRPYPPETLVVDRFNLFEEVDAYYNDGWWVGVISKVRVGSKYLVYFRDTDEEMEFEHSDLRPHQDWIDSKWVIASRALNF